MMMVRSIFLKIFLKFFLGMLMLLAIAFIFTFPVFAEPTAPVDAIKHQSTARADVTEFGLDSKYHSVGEFLQAILQFFFSILGTLALLGVVSGSAMIMLGGANESLAEKGKSVLFYSAIGVGVSMLAYVLTTLTQTFFYSFDG